VDYTNQIIDKFDVDAIEHVKKSTGDSDHVVRTFFLHVEGRSTNSGINKVVDKWDGLADNQKVSMAINYAGVYYVSKFVVLMNYLSKREKGGK